ncbi:MAG TPA: hypothetical protein VF297_31860 [Pyrinomonadaceae bacterium]
MAKKSSIPIWTTATPESAKAALPRLGGAIAAGATEVVSVSVETVKKNLDAFLEQIGPLLESSREALKGYEIEEIELSLAVNGSGGIELVGKLEAGAQAGMKIKLKRKQVGK